MLTRQPDRSAQGTARRCRRWSRELAAAGIDVTLDIVGPTIGLIGEREREAIALTPRRRSGVADRVHLRGAVPLDQLLPLYRDYDSSCCRPGPAKAFRACCSKRWPAGCRSSRRDVAGISEPDQHERERRAGAGRTDAGDGRRGALADHDAVAAPAADPERLRNGARAHARAQAARMMQVVAAGCGVPMQPCCAADVMARRVVRSVSCCRRSTAAAPSGPRCRF